MDVFKNECLAVKKSTSGTYVTVEKLQYITSLYLTYENLCYFVYFHFRHEDPEAQIIYLCKITDTGI